jgi:hypothetical protein
MSKKSQACFKSANFRRLNFAELIYSEVGFCFHTASVVTGSRAVSGKLIAEKLGGGTPEFAAHVRTEHK